MSNLPPAPGEGEPPPGSSAEAGFTPSTPEQPEPSRMNTLAIVAFVLSIAGLLLFGIILGVVAVVLGGVAFRQIDQNPGRYRGRGLAIAAMVIGAIDVLLAVLIISALD